MFADAQVKVNWYVCNISMYENPASSFKHTTH